MIILLIDLYCRFVKWLYEQFYNQIGFDKKKRKKSFCCELGGYAMPMYTND